jgi:hypothetical protein
MAYGPYGPDPMRCRVGRVFPQQKLDRIAALVQAVVQAEAYVAAAASTAPSLRPAASHQ